MAFSQLESTSRQIEIDAISQTNLQLWKQLRQAGYGSDELRLINRAYQVAMVLFSGRFRASGKSFVAHLIGTASILGHLGLSTPLVAAGLLHAAYEFGDFGGCKRSGVTTSKQKWMCRQIGAEVEQYIAEYSTLIWNGKTIPVIKEILPEWGEVKRSVLLIRLANELEEYLDLGILYCGNKSQIYSQHQGDIIADLAKALGFPGLAQALASAQQIVDDAQVPLELVNPTNVPNSALIVPYSCCRTFVTRLTQSRVSRLLQRLWYKPYFQTDLSYDPLLKRKCKAP